MGCNCKNDGTMQQMVENSSNKSNNAINYVSKSIVFLISMVFLPLIIALTIWVLFKTIVLGSSINLKPMLTAIVNMAKNKTDDEDDEEMDEDEFYSLTEDDVILLDAEDITNK